MSIQCVVTYPGQPQSKSWTLFPEALVYGKSNLGEVGYLFSSLQKQADVVLSCLCWTVLVYLLTHSLNFTMTRIMSGTNYLLSFSPRTLGWYPLRRIIIYFTGIMKVTLHTSHLQLITSVLLHPVPSYLIFWKLYLICFLFIYRFLGIYPSIPKL